MEAKDYHKNQILSLRAKKVRLFERKDETFLVLRRHKPAEDNQSDSEAISVIGVLQIAEFILRA